jgi:hypothetical protein
MWYDYAIPVLLAVGMLALFIFVFPRMKGGL